MTREQVVNLRPGQLVLIKLATGFWRIVKVNVPETRQRVFELEAMWRPDIASHVWVGADQITWADRATSHAA